MTQKRRRLPGNRVKDERVVVVGASLSGLTFALACGKLGIFTRVLERARPNGRHGTALGIDRTLLQRVTGFDPRLEQNGILPVPVVTGLREATSWYAVYKWLRERALRCKEIRLTEDFAVSHVTQDRGVATAFAADGRQISSHIIIGADGFRSVVRAAINPTEPNATYAGYILWRGLVDERDLPTTTQWAQNDQGGGFISACGYRLIAYPVPGSNGSIQPGERQISFAWYDSTRDDLLREQRCLSESHTVLAGLTREKIPQRLWKELLHLARNIWPDPWRTPIVHAFENQAVFATPITEYAPERLHRGRLGIIGDDAHVVSPITGRGFAAGLLDAETLATCLKESDSQNKPLAAYALPRYENERLEAARELAITSKKWSCEFINEFCRRKQLLLPV